MRPFTVDVEEVEAVVSDLAATQSCLEALAADLDAQMHALHTGWAGVAAAGHERAHRRWRESLDELGMALSHLRAAGASAAAAYRGASGANAAMWRQLG